MVIACLSMMFYLLLLLIRIAIKLRLLFLLAFVRNPCYVPNLLDGSIFIQAD